MLSSGLRFSPLSLIQEHVVNFGMTDFARWDFFLSKKTDLEEKEERETLLVHDN